MTKRNRFDPKKKFTQRTKNDWKENSDQNENVLNPWKLMLLNCLTQPPTQTITLERFSKVTI